MGVWVGPGVRGRVARRLVAGVYVWDLILEASFIKALGYSSMGSDWFLSIMTVLILRSSGSPEAWASFTTWESKAARESVDGREDV